MTSVQGPQGGDAARNGLILVAAAVVIGLVLMLVGRDDGESAGDTSTSSTSSVPDDTVPTETSNTLPGTGVTTPPAELAIVVGNGSGKDGLAGNTKDFLAGAGYTSVEAMNANTAAATAVYFVAGAEADAAAVATVLGLPTTPAPTLLPTPPPVTGPIGAAKVVVVLADDPPAVAAASGSTVPADTGTDSSSTLPGDTTGDTTDTSSDTADTAGQVPVGN